MQIYSASFSMESGTYSVSQMLPTQEVSTFRLLPRNEKEVDKTL
jgi:hypothetical protein